jgi:carboxymethylenebutenolidase
MSRSRVESVQIPDGTFDLTVWLPDAGTGPGLLLIQEIYGVSDYIRAVGEDLAGLAESLVLSSRFDAEQGAADAGAALQHLRSLPEVAGGLGVIGFCLGGSIAFFLATQEELDAVVSFYGSAVPGHLEVLEQIDGPLQLHFGGSDSYISRDQVAAVEQAAAGRDNVEIHVEEDAGHAFHNRKAPMFYVPEPAARAWQRTEEFLRRHLPVREQTPSGS